MNTDRIIKLLKEQGQIILQGAPGTGKTYATVELAVALCCPDEYSTITKHKELKEKYDTLVKNGRVAFTTFHQSMDYEDFVEGYKPATEKERQNDPNTQFVLRDGIFKEICQKARYKKTKKKVIVKDNNNGEYILISIDSTKVRYGSYNTIRQKAVYNEWNSNSSNGQYEKPTGVRPGNTIAENICEKLQTNYSGKDFNDRWKALLNDIYACSLVSAGKYNLLPSIIQDTIRSYSEATRTFDNLGKKYKDNGNPTGIESAILKKLEDYNASSFEDALNKLKSEMEEEEPQPYLLIIDEINRANISKVMGELITLLEKGKREGNEDARSAKLPYSQEEFTVPDNLYIIGTMNTADRSLGSIDYAIRRRFAFVTLEANQDLAQNHKTEFDAVKGLIEECRDDDFEVDEIMVGHSYFMPKTDNEWQRNIDYKIIPLLLEYFKDGVLIDKENKIFTDRKRTKKDQLKSYLKFSKNQ